MNFLFISLSQIIIEFYFYYIFIIFTFIFFSLFHIPDTMLPI